MNILHLRTSLSLLTSSIETPVDVHTPCLPCFIETQLALVQVYEAVSCMAQRQLQRAANLLLDSVATFTTYELFSYEQCVFYAVSTAMITLPRPQLKKKARP
jgi:hypothetical protein